MAVTQFTCAQCSTVNQLTLFTLREMKVKAMPQRCHRCGIAYGCTPAGVERISPMMRPWGTVGRASPWMDRRYRPTVGGYYQCYFQGIEQPLLLQWLASKGPFLHNNEVVNLRTLQKWRGVWE